MNTRGEVTSAAFAQDTAKVSITDAEVRRSIGESMSSMPNTARSVCDFARENSDERVPGPGVDGEVGASVRGVEPSEVDEPVESVARSAPNTRRTVRSGVGEGSRTPDLQSHNLAL